MENRNYARCKCGHWVVHDIKLIAEHLVEAHQEENMLNDPELTEPDYVTLLREIRVSAIKGLSEPEAFKEWLKAQETGPNADPVPAPGS